MFNTAERRFLLLDFSLGLVGCQIAIRLDHLHRSANGEILFHERRFYITSLDPSNVSVWDLDATVKLVEDCHNGRFQVSIEFDNRRGLVQQTEGDLVERPRLLLASLQIEGPEADFELFVDSVQLVHLVDHSVDSLRQHQAVRAAKGLAAGRCVPHDFRVIIQ